MKPSRNDNPSPNFNTEEQDKKRESSWAVSKEHAAKTAGAGLVKDNIINGNGTMKMDSRNEFAIYANVQPRGKEVIECEQKASNNDLFDIKKLLKDVPVVKGKVVITNNQGH